MSFESNETIKPYIRQHPIESDETPIDFHPFEWKGTKKPYICKHPIENETKPVVNEQAIYKLEFHFFKLLKCSLQDITDFDTFHLFLIETRNELCEKNPALKSSTEDSSCRTLGDWIDTTRRFFMWRKKQLFEPNEIADYTSQIRFTVHRLIKQDLPLFDDIRAFFVE